MSIDEVEEKFTLSQLIIMGIIQRLQFDHEKNQHQNNGRTINKHPDPKEQNRRAWKHL